MYFSSCCSINRLIFSQSSCSDGISAVGGPPGELLAVGVPFVRGTVSGDVVRVGVGIGWGDGGSTCRGAVWGVRVVTGVVCFVLS